MIPAKIQQLYHNCEKVAIFNIIPVFFCKGRHFVEKNGCFPLSNSAVTVSFLFPHWEHFIPTLGMFCSHLGNIMFPRWE